jgi:hypothetical protein
MKRYLASFLLVVTMMTVAVPKADAVAALIFRKKIIAILGGASAGMVGVSLIAKRIVEATSSATFAGLGWGSAAIGFGLAGIVLLDDDTADYQFPVIGTELRPHINATDADIEIYNSEVNRLNRIKELLERELPVDVSVDEAQKAWDMVCTEYLSTTTCQVKSLVAEQFFTNMRMK